MWLIFPPRVIEVTWVTRVTDVTWKTKVTEVTGNKGNRDNL